MQLYYRNGLLFTLIYITFRGKSKKIDNVVLDTGACESIISPDIISDLGILPVKRFYNGFYIIPWLIRR